MKTLITVDREVWARVKYFSEIEKSTVNQTVEKLLDYALKKHGIDPIKK